MTDVDHLRRPGLLAGVYNKTITPTDGSSWYRLLGFIATQEQWWIFAKPSGRRGTWRRAWFGDDRPLPRRRPRKWYGFIMKGKHLTRLPDGTWIEG